MPDPCTIPFHDYYEAVLVAHQLEDEGHRADVYEYGWAASPLPGSYFRLVVFEDGMSGEPHDDGSEVEFGEFDSGPIGRFIDDLLRLVTASGICFVPGYFFYFLFNTRPPVYEPGKLILPIFISFVLLISGVAGTIAAYHSFRERRIFGLVVMLGVGWCICVSYLLNLAIGLVYFLASL